MRVLGYDEFTRYACDDYAGYLTTSRRTREMIERAVRDIWERNCLAGVPYARAYREACERVIRNAEAYVIKKCKEAAERGLQSE